MDSAIELTTGLMGSPLPNEGHTNYDTHGPRAGELLEYVGDSSKEPSTVASGSIEPVAQGAT